MAEKSKNEIQLEKRLIDLETSLGLLQHDFEAQNEMILLNTRQLEQMQRTIKRMSAMIEALPPTGSPEGPRSLEDEKPPHY